jgi:predicted DNA binding CopG/RHH family protein
MFNQKVKHLFLMQKGEIMAREDCIIVKLSEKEKSIIREKAEKQGLTISAYVRQVLVRRK